MSEILPVFQDLETSVKYALVVAETDPTTSSMALELIKDRRIAYLARYATRQYEPVDLTQEWEPKTLDEAASAQHQQLPTDGSSLAVEPFRFRRYLMGPEEYDALYDSDQVVLSRLPAKKDELEDGPFITEYVTPHVLLRSTISYARQHTITQLQK